jgi:hypothetical protein
VDGGIDLDKENFGTVGGELLCGLFVFWGERFAVSAPRGVELDENVAGSLKDIVEVVSATDDDAAFLLEFGANAHKGDQSEKFHSRKRKVKNNIIPGNEEEILKSQKFKEDKEENIGKFHMFTVCDGLISKN